MPGQQTGLDVGKETERYLLIEDRMMELVLLPLLVGHDDFISTRVIQISRPPWPYLEMSFSYLFPVDEGECQPVRQYRAELLHEVQPERWPTRPQSMEETELRVETYSLDRTDAV